MAVIWRLLAVVAAMAVAATVLVYLEVGHEGGDAPPARAETATPAQPTTRLDSVRFKSWFLRHREVVLQARAERRAAAREARARREARREARQRAAERAAQRAAERAAQRAAERAAAREARQERPSGGLIVGDSVSLGAQRCLSPLGYRLDSEVGRQFAVGLQRLRIQAERGLPDTVVVHLGTNGPFGTDGFRQVMDLLGNQRRVVWVTIALPGRSQYAFRDSLNRMITEQGGRYGNVRIADFGAASDQHPEWFYEDGVHINSAGCEGFARIVDDAVTEPSG